MSHTVTRGNSCNYPYRYAGHKIYLARLQAAKYGTHADAIAESDERFEFEAVETITFDTHDDDFVEAMLDLLTGCPDGPSCDYDGCPVGRANNAPLPTGVYHADDDVTDGGFWG